MEVVVVVLFEVGWLEARPAAASSPRLPHRRALGEECLELLLRAVVLRTAALLAALLARLGVPLQVHLPNMGKRRREVGSRATAGAG